MWVFIYSVPLKIRIATTIKAVLHITCVKRKDGKKNTTENETLGQAVSFPLAQWK